MSGNPTDHTIRSGTQLDHPEDRTVLADDDPRHGTVHAYVNLRCRCRRCKDARSTYDARRRTSTQRRITAHPVRRHLTQLLADGATVHSIAIAAQVGYATTRSIARGDTGWVQARTAEQLLAITIDQCRRRATGSIEWRRHATCADSDQTVDLWFPTKEPTVGGDTPTYTATEKAAKAVCARCPVADDCLTYAIDNRINHGIWGGLSATERAELHQGAA